MQTIIVIAIVALAALYVARRMWRSLAASKKPKESVGCANCDAVTGSADDWAR